MQISLFGPTGTPRPTDPATPAPAPEPPPEREAVAAPPVVEAPVVEEPVVVEEPIVEEPVLGAPETVEPDPAEGSPPGPPGDLPPPDGGDPPDPPGTVSLARAARERYLNYAMSVITARALPDVRDGLKPVQRRILYAMYANLRLLPTNRFRKSAAVVGAVMASYHPHGDQSIYDAMVRLAQPFSLRGPLVEGHGNFGSLDGDPPAAMRYTECRLRALALELVREIDRDTVTFRPNYDGTSQEPVVLPARVPQLLINGSTGIAVGMATNIPPHNLREVCRAAVALIDDPELTTPGLLEHIEGPDFPIGGEILNTKEELLALYSTGRGAIKLRATWHEEKQGRRRYAIVTSIPWGKNKATLIEKVGELVRDGHLPQLTDVRDESTDDVRITLELKRGAEPTVAMAYLFKHTDLQINWHVNMTVLLPTENPEVGAPAQVGLRTVLRQFLDFRFEVVRRRFEFDLNKLLRRIHILQGFELIFDALDEAIVLIRGSEGKKDAAGKLIARFGLDAEQTEAILELKLYRLAKLEILVIREELAEKRAEAARIQAILASDAALWGEVRGELLDVAAEHGDDRRTRLVGPHAELEFDPDAYIVREDAWVIVTRKGWIKRQSSFSTLDAIRVREGDEVGWALRCSTISTVTFYTGVGRAYVVRVDDIPQTTGYGEPIQRRFAFDDGDTIVGVVPNDPRLASPFEYEIETEVAEPVEGDLEDDLEGHRDHEGDSDHEGDHEAVVTEPAAVEPVAVERESVGAIAVAVTRAGKGLLFPLSSHAEPSTRNGRRFCTLGSPGDAVVAVRVVRSPDDNVCLATEQGRVLVFEASSLKFLRGTGKGVNAIRLGDDDAVIDFVLRSAPKQGLAVQTSRGRDLVVSAKKYGVVSRGGKGLEVIKRGTLVALPRSAVVAQPPAEDADGFEDDEDLDELDAIAAELERDLSPEPVAEDEDEEDDQDDDDGDDDDDDDEESE